MTNQHVSVEGEVVYQELAALLSKHSKNVSAREILAIAANMVGKLIGLQDQRTMTHDEATHIVISNIELGNQQIIETLLEIPVEGRS